MNNSVETLVAQAYGAKDYHMCGVILWRGRILVSLLCLPLMLLLFFSEKVFASLGIGEGQAEYAAGYCSSMVLGIFMFAHTDLQRQFLNCI